MTYQLVQNGKMEVETEQQIRPCPNTSSHRSDMRVLIFIYNTLCFHGVYSIGLKM